MPSVCSVRWFLFMLQWNTKQERVICAEIKLKGLAQTRLAPIVFPANVFTKWVNEFIHQHSSPTFSACLTQANGANLKKKKPNRRSFDCLYKVERMGIKCLQMVVRHYLDSWNHRRAIQAWYWGLLPWKKIIPPIKTIAENKLRPSSSRLIVFVFHFLGLGGCICVFRASCTCL